MGELSPNMSVREMSIQVLGPRESCAPALTLEKLVKENLLDRPSRQDTSIILACQGMRRRRMRLETGEMIREARE